MVNWLKTQNTLNKTQNTFYKLLPDPLLFSTFAETDGPTNCNVEPGRTGSPLIPSPFVNLPGAPFTTGVSSRDLFNLTQNGFIETATP